MKLLNKIIHSIFSRPKSKSLSDKCEVFLYPETAEKLKMIGEILEKEQKKSPYDNDFESSRAELFRKVVGIAYLILLHCFNNDKIVLIERKKKKEKKIWLSPCLKK